MEVVVGEVVKMNHYKFLANNCLGPVNHSWYGVDTEHSGLILVDASYRGGRLLGQRFVVAVGLLGEGADGGSGE